MAFNIVGTTYSGEASTEFYSEAIHQSGTIANGHILINPNVKSKIALRKADVGDILQADGCDFTASGDIILDERLLEVTPLKVNTEVCVSDLESDWISRNMAAGSDAGIPASENAMFLQLMSKRIGNQIENLIWSGDTASATPGLVLMDGFLKIADNDIDTAKVPAPIAITSANVLAELERGYNLIPDGILVSPNLRLYVSMKVFRAYTAATSTIGAASVYNIQAGFGQVFYKGIEVLPSQGMGAGSRYLFAEKNNLTFGTDLVSDFDNIKVLDMNAILGSNKVRFVGRMKAGVQYGVSSELVIY